MLNHPCVPGIDPTWSRCIILLMVIEFCLLVFFEDFCINVYQEHWFTVFLSCLCLTLGSGLCWSCRMRLEVFSHLRFFERVWGALVLILLQMFGGIHQWSPLILSFPLLDYFDYQCDLVTRYRCIEIFYSWSVLVKCNKYLTWPLSHITCVWLTEIDMLDMEVLSSQYDI